MAAEGQTAVKEQKSRILDLEPRTGPVDVWMNHRTLRDFSFRRKGETQFESVIHRAGQLCVHIVSIDTEEDRWDNLVGKTIRIQYKAKLTVPGQEMPKVATKLTQVLNMDDIAEYQIEYPYREDWYFE